MWPTYELGKLVGTAVKMSFRSQADEEPVWDLTQPRQPQDNYEWKLYHKALAQGRLARGEQPVPVHEESGAMEYAQSDEEDGVDQSPPRLEPGPEKRRPFTPDLEWVKEQQIRFYRENADFLARYYAGHIRPEEK